MQEGGRADDRPRRPRPRARTSPPACPLPPCRMPAATGVAPALRRRVSSSTASAMTTPMTTCCQKADTDRRLRPLRSTARISAPISVPDALPMPPARRGAADDDRGDRVQLVALGGLRLRGGQTGGEHDARDGGEETGEGVDGELLLLHAQPGQPGRLLVAADRVHGAADVRPAEHEGRDQTHRRSSRGPAPAASRRACHRGARPSRGRRSGSPRRSPATDRGPPTASPASR